MVSAQRVKPTCLTLGFVALLGCGEGGRRSSPPELAEASPWPTLQVRCPPGTDAATVADLERQARAQWQRARFDPADGPRAVQQVGVAIACAGSRGDLQTVSRLSGLRDGWKHEVERRLDQETVRLELSLRAGDAPAMRTHARRLGALLHTGDTPEVQRSLAWLRQTERRARVKLAARGEEEP